MIDEVEVRARIAEDGFCVFPSVLAGQELAMVRAAVDRVIEAATVVRQNTVKVRVDPNDRNVRLTALPERSPVFTELLRHPLALAGVRAVLGPHAYVSNFTGNVALPGSESMRLHSDQALAIPAPWPEPLSMNVIWCIDDVHKANGATQYLPGSHRFRDFSDVPADAADRLCPFEAPAGSAICMEGRLWHTSGANRTVDERRAMLFGYYVRSHVRGNVNWDAMLSEPVKQAMDDETRRLLGMGPVVYHPPALGLVALDEPEAS